LVISLRRVDKAYPVGEETFYALREVDLDIAAGELVFVVGKSGTGKSP
jgi:putative ABC transport system ATP-binding protein